MPCSSSCPDGNHATWGECVRAKGLHVGFAQEHAGRDASAQKRADKALDAYADARKEGIQPRSTRLADIQRAIDISDQTGTAYQA